MCQLGFRLFGSRKNKVKCKNNCIANIVAARGRDAICARSGKWTEKMRNIAEFLYKQNGANIIAVREKDEANIFAYKESQKMKKIAIQQINLHCNKSCWQLGSVWAKERRDNGRT